METKNETEGLLWIQISEESLHHLMLGQYSTRRLRERLQLLDKAGVIQISKDQIGAVQNILYNYRLVDRCITLGNTVQHVLTGQMSGGFLPSPPDKQRTNVGQMSGGDDPVKEYRKEEEEKDNSSPLPPPPEGESPGGFTKAPIDPETGEELPADRIAYLNQYEKRKALNKARKQAMKQANQKAVTDTMRNLEKIGDKRVAAQNGVNHQDSPADTATVTAGASIAVLWNHLVPEKPTDLDVDYSKFECYDDLVLRNRFHEICTKSRELIKGGMDITFTRLLRQDKQTAMYGFELILAGDWDWRIARKSTPPPVEEVVYPKYQRRWNHDYDKDEPDPAV